METSAKGQLRQFELKVYRVLKPEQLMTVGTLENRLSDNDGEPQEYTRRIASKEARGRPSGMRW